MCGLHENFQRKKSLFESRLLMFPWQIFNRTWHLAPSVWCSCTNITILQEIYFGCLKCMSHLYWISISLYRVRNFHLGIKGMSFYLNFNLSWESTDHSVVNLGECQLFWVRPNKMNEASAYKQHLIWTIYCTHKTKIF